MTILVVDGVAKIRRKEGALWVSDPEGNTLEQPIPDLELLVIVGQRVQVTSSILLTLANNNIPIVLVDGRGQTIAIVFDPIQVGTIGIREAQYKCIASDHCRLIYAREIVRSKLRGLLNLVRYEAKYHRKELESIDVDYEKTRIQVAIEDIQNARSIDELRILEAQGSQPAWKIITALIPQQYGFTGRNPRAGDTINAAINLAYAILYGIATKALVATGLDPYAGFMHVPRQGRLSLVYDFTEIYKPLAIHAVIQASRITRLKQWRGSSKLTPKTVETIIKQLYHKLHQLNEKTYRRKSIWVHTFNEANKLKTSLTKTTQYQPYTYNPLV